VSGELVTPVTPGGTSTTRAKNSNAVPYARKGVTTGDGVTPPFRARCKPGTVQRDRGMVNRADSVYGPAADGSKDLGDLLSQGRLPHLKDGARVLIRRAELLGYLEGER